MDRPLFNPQMLQRLSHQLIQALYIQDRVIQAQLHHHRVHTHRNQDFIMHHHLTTRKVIMLHTNLVLPSLWMNASANEIDTTKLNLSVPGKLILFVFINYNF